MQGLKFSIIIPVYNRPTELDELLESLCKQTFKNFDVIVVEDGSTQKSQSIVEKYSENLEISYFYKDNSGPGLSRNYGAEHSKSDYFIFFDSDCIIPSNYIEIVTTELAHHYVDAFGGPDAAHQSFTAIQKAISYSMTSVLTTGGIRGGNEKAEKFTPRSFNMGLSRKAFEATGGFSSMRFGEDVDLSIRILEQGIDTKLIKEAFVYHKRRTDFRKFFKQVFNSGTARINLFKRHKNSLKLVHLLPAVFLLGNIICIVAALTLGIIYHSLLMALICLSPLILYALMLFFHSLTKNSLKVATLSVLASFIQLDAYGLGFFKAVVNILILKREDVGSFEKTFYK